MRCWRFDLLDEINIGRLEFEDLSLDDKFDKWLPLLELTKMRLKMMLLIF